MRHVFRAAALTLALALGLATPGWSADQTATEIKKDLFPKYKKAQADGKDLGEAGKEYEAGDKSLKDGLQEEALEHFKKAKDLWPKE
jgi:hypothetical protein